MERILIGTSGYDYPEWKGSFYPEELKRADFLSYYASQFNAVELNNTFYNMPTAERLMSFYERSAGRIEFSIKANKLLTHEVSRSWREDALNFKKALVPLLEKERLSAVLFQFAQGFRYTAENRIYLAKLIAEFEGFPVVIEFRHKEWIRESVFAGLAERKASVVFCDMPELKALPNADFGLKLYSQFIGPNAYIRLHGRNAGAWYANGAETLVTFDPAAPGGAAPDRNYARGTNGSARYEYDYCEDELKEFVPVVRTAVREGRKVQVYFNNHPKGHGAKNARLFIKMLEVNP